MSDTKRNAIAPTTPPPPFFYLGTDPTPPGGVTGYGMNSNNLAPALVAWLFLTTNPAWVGAIDANGNANDPAMGANSSIGSALGLTKGTVDFIFKIAHDSPGLFTQVGTLFQTINNASTLPGNYRPPCPPTYQEILLLAPSAWVTNPGVAAMRKIR